MIFPKATRILPTLARRPPGSDVNVTKPSSTSTLVSEKERKKSARAYGSTIACKATSDSRRLALGRFSTEFFPETARKLPMTEIDGLK